MFAKLKLLITLTIALVLGGLLVFPQNTSAAGGEWKSLTGAEFTTLFNISSAQYASRWNEYYTPAQITDLNAAIKQKYNDPTMTISVVRKSYGGLVYSADLWMHEVGTTLKVENNYLKAVNGTPIYAAVHGNGGRWVQHSSFYQNQQDATFEIKPLRSFVEIPVVMKFEYYYPADGKLVISQEKLNNAANTDSLLVLKLSGYKYIRAAIDGGNDAVVDWDKETDFEKVISKPELEAYVDLTETFKKVKSRLGVGKHKIFFQLYSQEDYDNPAEVDPTMEAFMDFSVVQKEGDVPPLDDNGTGGHPADPTLPQTPKPPDGAWDVVGWLKYILDWILYIVNAVGYLLNRLGTIIASLFGQANGLTSTLTSIFSFLPPEVTSLLVMGIILSILLRVFGK